MINKPAIKFIALATIVLPLLSGCFEKRITTAQLCEDHEALNCLALNLRDSQCRIQRTNLIWQRFEVLKEGSDLNKFEELMFVDDYQKCLDLSARIEPIQGKEVKSLRSTALLHTYDEQERLRKVLKTSEEVSIIYYRWSQGDNEARRQFLQLEGTGKLQTPEMQFALATFYTTRDSKKTIALLHRSLELTEADSIKPEVIKSLASVNQKDGSKQRAYMWALVGKEFDLPIAPEAQLNLLYNFTAEQKTQLANHADAIAEAIKKGQFKPSLLPEEIATN